MIIKDLMCLKKQLLIFAFLVICVTVFAFMFGASAEYGNIAKILREAETEASGDEMKMFFVLFYGILMLLPVASVGDAMRIAEEDRKAGFVKISATAPLSIKQRVLTKYIMFMAIPALGGLISLVITFFLSGTTEIIRFGQVAAIILLAVSFLWIYNAWGYVELLIMGKGKENITGQVTLVILMVILIVSWLVIFTLMEKGILHSDMIEQMGRAVGRFFLTKSYVVLLVSAGLVVILYFVAAALAERKRGEI